MNPPACIDHLFAILAVMVLALSAAPPGSTGQSSAHPTHDAMAHSQAAYPPTPAEVELQPLGAQVRRLVTAAGIAGEPFSDTERTALDAAMAASDPAAGVAAIQRILDARCLFIVTINPEMRVSAVAGPARPVLVEQGWRTFLVKVANLAGATAPLVVVSPNALSVHNAASERTDSDRSLHPDIGAPLPPASESWMDLQVFDGQPLGASLSGLGLEYRLVQVYSRDAGRREAKFAFSVGQGTQDLGFRNECDVLFDCHPARAVRLHVRDENGTPTTASFVIRDDRARVYPSLAKRLAPDFAFQPQIYRADGETLKIPDGSYDIVFRRGPESIPETRRVVVDAAHADWDFQVRRWIDPAAFGWWSGDHHIHAAGCAHYTCPTEGVLPADMARHCRGEDLKIGANLTWGPGFDYQKQFFTGREDAESVYPYLLRYDIEVSGFGSHRSGHLCLLRLRDEMYPGGTSSAHWPTLGLNTARWAKAQGAVVGTAHSGLGLGPIMLRDVKPAGPTAPGAPVPPTDILPNTIVPPFSGVGANEYVVDVTHEVPGPDGRLVPAIDFYALGDTPHTWELNMWYHSLNAGFRTRASGETDFPCLSGERVGVMRSYVKIDGRLTYDSWCEGIRAGRCYVSDGFSHIIDFEAGGRPVGVDGSELRLAAPGSVRVKARVAALLADSPDRAVQYLPADQKPFWNIERARIGATRRVPLELIVNGESVATQEVTADGTLRDVVFEAPVARSSWVALRIRASSHTNPIFILVGGKPIRPSRRSVAWCLEGVDRCWSQKERFIAPAELPEARRAYEHARAVYRARLDECDVE